VSQYEVLSTTGDVDTFTIIQNLNKIISSRRVHHMPQPKFSMGSFPKQKIAAAQRHYVILKYYKV
jgi:hypothetical protein